MAEAKKTGAEAVVAAPAKPKSKWIPLVIVAALCLALGGGAAFFLLKKQPPAETAEAGEAATQAVKKKKSEKAEAPVFYKFDKAFTVKLQTEAQEAYLQTEVQFKLLDAHGLDAIKQNEPDLKHRITLALMGKKASALGSAQGVQKLANELRDIANRVVTPPPAKDKPAADAEPAEAADPGAVVQSVLFSTFIVQ